MSESKREEQRKEAVKGFIDGIDTGTEIGRMALDMVYGFTRKCFLESNMNRAARQE